MVPAPVARSDVLAGHEHLAFELLQFEAEFARVRDAISWLLHDWTAASPSAVPAERWGSPGHLKDEHRPAVVEAVAKACTARGDRSQFDVVFQRCKSWRDLVAHASFINTLTLADGEPVLGVPHYVGDKRVRSLPDHKGMGLNDSRATLRLRDVVRRRAEARWLHDHVYWVQEEAGLFGGPSTWETAPTQPPPPRPPIK